MDKRKILEVTRLTKKFGNIKNQFTAVDDISFSVPEGEIVGLLGPNGAGKTTTINMLLGVLKPTIGVIKIFGLDFEKNRQKIAKQMNFSASYINLPWKLTVRENLFIFGKIYEVNDLKNRINKLIEDFRLRDIQNKYFQDLSSGQQARVCLCKAFINKPKLLLLDEPTAFMDPDVADILRTLILTFVKEDNTTVIFSSHNMAEVTELCDRVIFINHGRIVAEDTPEALAKKIGFCRINLLISDGQKRTFSWCLNQGLKAVSEGKYIEVEINEKEIAPFLSKLAEIGVQYDEISIDKPTLEDFFLKVARSEKNE